MTPNTPAGGAVAGYVDGSRIDELRQGRLNIALWSQPIGCSQTPLYTTPPATVSADAVLALVEKWRASAATGTFTCGSGEAYREATNECADELEALTRGEK